MLLLKLITVLLPWKLKRIFLIKFFNYDIAPSARIGLSWIFPKKLIMKDGAKINHFTVAIHLDKITMESKASISRDNWITGFPFNNKDPHFIHQTDRRAELIMGESSAITKKHHLDCTNIISIGKFSIIAGYDSQFLTHSIDIIENRQHSAPIYIGDYCFVSTNVAILGGSNLPSHSVLGAKALLNKSFDQEYYLYGGVPAKEIQEISKDAKYFHRTSGFVY